MAEMGCVGVGSEVVDFVVEPESGKGKGDEERLATAGDDGKVKIWKIPKGVVEGIIGEPEVVIECTWSSLLDPLEC
jgi:hypothetical protein